MRNALYIQSGGPTAVINASACGVIREARAHPDRIGRLYAARYGTVGVLEGRLIDTGGIDGKELRLLEGTPSMAFGSSRYRMVDYEEDERDYRKFLEVLREREIGYLFLNGGNGTLASAQKLHRYLGIKGYDCRVIVIPKTVDNDIEGIDHSPGYPSAARHVIQTIGELSHDTRSYDTGLITVVEVMGRNTGWLAAASMAACAGNHGPDLIYVPEVGFRYERFIEDVDRVYRRDGKCLVVVAEGIRDETGRYVFERAVRVDNPGLNMGGAAASLAAVLRERFDCKVRDIDLGLMQRCAAHAVAPLDAEEAVSLGRRAVREAISGATASMVSLERQQTGAGCAFRDTLVPIEEAANGGHRLPGEYIAGDGCSIRAAFLDYLLPLVGELPRYARFDL